VQLLWAAYSWTQDAKYLAPIESVVGKGDHAALSLLNANASTCWASAKAGAAIWPRPRCRKGGEARDSGARPPTSTASSPGR